MFTHERYRARTILVPINYNETQKHRILKLKRSYYFNMHTLFTKSTPSDSTSLLNIVYIEDILWYMYVLIKPTTYSFCDITGPSL